MTPEERHQQLKMTREICLANAEAFLSVAEREMDRGVDHVCYHLALLAMEEIGKSLLATINFAKQRAHDTVWAWIPTLRLNMHDTLGAWVPILMSNVHDSLSAWGCWPPTLRGNMQDTSAAHYAKADTNGTSAGGVSSGINSIVLQKGNDIIFHKKADTLFIGLDTTSFLTATQARDTTGLMIRDSLNVVVARHIGNDSIAVGKINWDNEYLRCGMVHGQSRALTDSIFLTLPQISNDWAISWLATDSAGNISPTKNDTLIASAFIPYICTIDSLIITYRNKNASSSIIRYGIRGPDRTDGVDLCDSTYLADATVSYTATSWTKVGINITDIIANAGETFAIKLVTAFAADYAAVDIGSIKLVVKR